MWVTAFNCLTDELIRKNFLGDTSSVRTAGKTYSLVKLKNFNKYHALYKFVHVYLYVNLWKFIQMITYIPHTVKKENIVL